MKIQTRPQQGFTLVELILALAVMAILCAVSAPALGSLAHSTQTRVARDALFASLNFARNTAVSKQAEIVVCPSTDQQTCSADIQWQTGWIVFQDGNGDGKRGANEPILQVTQTQAGVAIVSSEHRNRIVFRADGTAPGSNATLTFCDTRRTRAAGTIVLSNAGRARQGNATADSDAACRQPARDA